MATTRKSRRKTPPAVHTLHIEGELTIYRAAELKAELLAAVAQHNRLAIDLSQVSEFDTAGVQVLMLAKQAARAAEGELQLQAHSPAVLEVMQLLDLAAFFGDPLLVPAAPQAAASAAAAA